jgi:hypothetical protein
VICRVPRVLERFDVWPYHPQMATQYVVQRESASLFAPFTIDPRFRQPNAIRAGMPYYRHIDMDLYRTKKLKERDARVAASCLEGEANRSAVLQAREAREAREA